MLAPVGNWRQSYRSAGALIFFAHKGFAESLLHEELVLVTLDTAAHIIKIDVGYFAWRRFGGLPIASDEAAPSIPIARIGEQAYCEIGVGSKTRDREVLAQGSASTVNLIEAPEVCRAFQWLQTVTYLIEQFVNIHLAESNLLPYHLRSDHTILHLCKNRGIKVRKLALTFEKQMIVIACARSSPPVFYPLFETTVPVLKDGRKFTFSALRSRFAAEKNNCLIA